MAESAADAVPLHHGLDAAVVAETVTLMEQRAPLEDSRELPLAFAHARTRQAQWRERARLLGERYGLRAEWQRLRRWVVFLLLLMGVLAAAAAWAAARGVLSPGHGINAMGALVALLGAHLVTLSAWLLGGLLWRAGWHMQGGWSFGRMALGLVAHLPLRRARHTLDLLAGFGALMQRRRLWPWLTGWISHSIWALALGVAVLVLLSGFAFQSHQLHWESTILSAEFFQRLVDVTGALPAMLGIPVPSADAVRHAGQAGVVAAVDATEQRQWAWWLIACVMFYGFLPRLLLAIWCGWRWRSRSTGLADLDASDPSVQAVMARFDRLEPPADVIDREHAGAWGATLPGQALAHATSARVVMGFELPAEAAWPLNDLIPVALSLCVAGGSDDMSRALGQLGEIRPQKVLLVVNAAGSPDRGTARFVHQVMQLVPQLALTGWGELTDGATGNHGAGLQRWQQWMQTDIRSGAASAPVWLSDVAQANAWLSQDAADVDGGDHG